MTHTASQWAPVKLATVPPGTKLPSRAYYLLGLAHSGLAAPTISGATTIHVRSTTGFEAGQTIDIDGETRNVVSVGTAAAPMTTVFIPVSTGPWLTIAAGATNVPVTNAAGFEVGQKVGIDIGGNYELATVTSVGKAATQTTLAAAAAAGTTNIKLAATANLTAGDTLTVGTGGRKELAKIASVGTSGASGAGANLDAPLEFGHMSGVDVSDVGTGISFTPATKFPHLSGDAVQALGGGITIDKPLAKAHEYGAPVRNPVAATVGYQGPPSPNQWFGGVLSARAGSIALMDASGQVVVDAMVYGSQQSSSSANGTITSPEIATLEAEQRQGGCIVVVSTVAAGAGRSRGRFPDGNDADSLCADFLTQPVTTVSAPSDAGATNIKVASVADFAAGQTVTIDTGANVETAVIATVGAAGATTVNVAANAGDTTISVANAIGFSPGQTITIDRGTNQETAVVASATRGRGGATIITTKALASTHAAGAQVSGSGITLAKPLTRPHASGTQVASGFPTPGAPNQYHVPRR